MMFSLDTYFKRIGFSGKAKVDWDTLDQIQVGQTCSIPFEHINVLSGIGVSLDPDKIFDKLVHQERGGYCFEQNNLLVRVLKEIGFDVVLIAGRVRIGQTRDFLPPRTHVFGKVSLNGETWIVDAGVGGFSLTSPIRWELDTEQTTRHETRRITFEEGRWFHQVRLSDTWEDIYEFTDGASPEIDQQLGNWWTSTQPKSKFSTSLSVGLGNRDGTRYAVFNDRFIHRRGSEILESQIIPNEFELRAILKGKFGLGLGPEVHFGGWPFTQT